MPESHHAVKPSLSFAKLVATPTDTAWSQAYNAGNLFACLSLSLQEASDEVSLQAVGKDILNLLESEFFTLEEKNTATIKEAITASLTKLPSAVTANLTLAHYKDNTLTVFIVGQGKVVMKRGEKIGVLLEKHTPSDQTVTSASGILSNADTVVLQTGAFAEGLPEQTVSGALELALPNDIVEALSPPMHEQDNGAQAAIVVSYHGTAPHVITEEVIETEEPTIASLYEQEATATEDDSAEKETGRKLPSFHFPKLPSLNVKLNHRKKLYLTIAVILLFLLAASIFFAVQKQNADQQQQLFQTIYTPAEQLYEEGHGLESLNKSLSRDSYLKAQKLLKEGEGKITKGTAEYQKMQDLLTKVESGLRNATIGKSSNAKEATAPANSLLAIEKETPDGLAFGQDGTSVYVVTDSAVTTVTKSSGSKKDVIKNNNAWSAPRAVVPYQGNIYILEKQGILKYVTGTKSSYFTGTAPDLTQASGMAIDGSVWIVLKNGKILKYTRGKEDSFSLTGLDKPLQNATKIVTNIDMDSVYVLDNGNSRVVKFDKKGAYQNAYSSDVLANAKDFEIFEKDKKIFILSDNKIWEIPM